MAAINYLFPPDQIDTLPTWRFVVHFVVPEQFDAGALARAISDLRAARWAIIQFPLGIDAIRYDASSQSIAIPIEVPEERRRHADSLAAYESDFWKVCGNMAASGFTGDIYYEALDWSE